MIGVWCGICEDLVFSYPQRLRRCSCGTTWIRVSRRGKISVGGDGSEICFHVNPSDLREAILKAPYTEIAIVELRGMAPLPAWVGRPPAADSSDDESRADDGAAEPDNGAA